MFKPLCPPTILHLAPWSSFSWFIYVYVAFHTSGTPPLIEYIPSSTACSVFDKPPRRARCYSYDKARWLYPLPSLHIVDLQEYVLRDLAMVKMELYQYQFLIASKALVNTEHLLLLSPHFLFLFDLSQSQIHTATMWPNSWHLKALEGHLLPESANNPVYFHNQKTYRCYLCTCIPRSPSWGWLQTKGTNCLSRFSHIFLRWNFINILAALPPRFANSSIKSPFW